MHMCFPLPLTAPRGHDFYSSILSLNKIQARHTALLSLHCILHSVQHAIGPWPATPHRLAATRKWHVSAASGCHEQSAIKTCCDILLFVIYILAIVWVIVRDNLGVLNRPAVLAGCVITAAFFSVCRWQCAQDSFLRLRTVQSYAPTVQGSGSNMRSSAVLPRPRNRRGRSDGIGSLAAGSLCCGCRCCCAGSTAAAATQHHVTAAPSCCSCGCGVRKVTQSRPLAAARSSTASIREGDAQAHLHRSSARRAAGGICVVTTVADSGKFLPLRSYAGHGSAVANRRMAEINVLLAYCSSLANRQVWMSSYEWLEDF